METTDVFSRGAPQADEIEISVFGPGVGECILVHLQDGRWLCIDCATVEDRPWPLWYLASIGLDPSAAITHIVASHWHADHVEGIAALAEACPNAYFGLSNALSTDEFLNLLGTRDTTERVRRADAEMQQVFDLYDRRLKATATARAPVLLSHNSNLLHEPNIQVWALSPSAKDVLRSKAHFAELSGDIGIADPGIKPNAAAVVIFIRIGAETILLGSDLEYVNEPHSGWNAVVANPLRDSSSDVFKIPHHGSAGAFCESIWHSGIQNAAHCVLTPYTRSGLPRQDQIERLRALGRQVYVTALPQRASIKRSPPIEKHTKRRTTAYVERGDGGHVRLRKRPTSNWKVELFGGATRL